MPLRRNNMKKRWIIVCLAVLICGLLYLYNQTPITVLDILSWQPDNLLLTALILPLFFAAKSVLVFIPIMLPQILTGHLCNGYLAILINALGLALVLSVPYWIGRNLGSAKMEQLLQKYPAIQNLLHIGIPYATNAIGGVWDASPAWC